VILTWLWIFFRKQRFVRLSLKNLVKESCLKIADKDKLTKWTKQYPNAKHLLRNNQQSR
jgi:hypothetical protein